MKKTINLYVVLTMAFLATQALANEEPPSQPSLTSVVTNDEGEKLIADSFGKTLYTFDLDINKPAPVCAGDCAEVWPPYILSTVEANNLQAPLGVIKRNNNKLQLTYEGKAVYTYIFDRSKGDEKGDGIGGVWHYIEIK